MLAVLGEELDGDALDLHHRGQLADDDGQHLVEALGRADGLDHGIEGVELVD